MQNIHVPRKCCGYRRWGKKKQLAREFLYHAALAIVLYEGVVLLGSTFGKGLEPVCIVSNAILNSPLLDTCCHRICNGTVKTGTVVNHVNHFFINIFGKILVHLLTVEYLLAKVFIGALCGRFHFNGLFLEGLAYNLKS